jgi:hypothetical protein
VLLVSLGNTVPVDLRNTPEFTFMPISSRMQFRVLIGTPAYVESELAKLLPTAYVLDQNYPNPFNAVTMLRYEIPEPSRILLTVYSMLGQEVKTLVDGIAQPGTYTVRWDGTNTAGRPVASGVYLARLMAGQRVVRVLKMTMVR